MSGGSFGGREAKGKGRGIASEHVTEVWAGVWAGTSAGMRAGADIGTGAMAGSVQPHAPPHAAGWEGRRAVGLAAARCQAEMGRQVVKANGGAGLSPSEGILDERVRRMESANDILAKLKSGELELSEVIANGWMLSVTERVRKTKQPRGGYVNPRDFDATVLDGGGIDNLNPEENVHPSLVGIAVDYLTRLASGTPTRNAFAVSGAGAENLGKTELFETLLSQVEGLDDASIRAAVKLTGFDCAKRASADLYRPVEGIEPDAPTVQNIRTMVERSLRFFEAYGPKVLDHLTFAGAYTKLVATGDGDFLTRDTLWDFKVSKKKPQSTHTLQLLMYWRMGLHSIHPEYQNVKYLGIFNPRLNTVYRLDVSKIPADVIATVETEVIGY